MFVHTGEDLPKVPVVAASLEEIGYKRNEKGQFVSVAAPEHHFITFISCNEQINEVRKEAMQECVQQEVIKDLAELGVVEVYLGGEEGKEILGVAPDGKPKGMHATILTTKLKELAMKRDVIVVIGEQKERLGIWAWRHLLKEGGIDGGSAVGLAKKLAVLGMDSTEVKYEDFIKQKKMGGKDLASMPPTSSGSGDTGTTHRDSLVEDPINVPGLVILNPGALTWSHQENKAMTIFSWLARHRGNALAGHYAIDPLHNKIPGHTTPYKHVETVMDSILPGMLREDAHLYIVGIHDGAESFINWYQARQCTVGTIHHNHSDVPGLTSMVNAMAFTSPTHDAGNLRCDAVEIMLEKRGRQWVKSSRPLGTFLNAPKPLGAPPTSSIPAATEAQGRAEETDLKSPEHDAAVIETAGPLTSHAGNEMNTTVGRTGEEELGKTMAGEAAEELIMPAITSAGSENVGVAPAESVPMFQPAKFFLGPDSSISSPSSEMQAPSSRPSDGITQLPELEKGLSDLSLSQEGSKMEASEPSLPFALHDEEKEEDADVLGMSISYDHLREIVNCATYSGETYVDEMIWPKAMDLALDHFKFVAEQTARPGFFGSD